MVVGVFIYSFSIGSLSSLLTNVDLKTQKFNDSMKVLVHIKKEYNISDNIFSKIKLHLRYGQKLEYLYVKKFIFKKIVI